MLGLPSAFAAHFAPDAMIDAITIYRARFTPSETLRQPYVVLGLSVFAADTDEEAAFIATSARRQMAELRQGMPGKLKPPSHEFLEPRIAGQTHDHPARLRSYAIVAEAQAALSVAVAA